MHITIVIAKYIHYYWPVYLAYTYYVDCYLFEAINYHVVDRPRLSFRTTRSSQEYKTNKYLWDNSYRSFDLG